MDHLPAFTKIAENSGGLVYGPRTWNITFGAAAWGKFMVALGFQSDAKFKQGDRVRKHSGAWWEGRVVGYYSTAQTPIGYCVQLDLVENGPVQIYPENALELAP